MIYEDKILNPLFNQEEEVPGEELGEAPEGGESEEEEEGLE